VVQTDPDNVDTPSAPAPGVPVPEASNEVVPAPERVKDWRSNIFFFWLSIVGTFGTLFGVGLSVYFYQASKIKPLLTFSIHPLRTELQRPDFDKELGFIYKGKPVESESITSIQMSIWNAGTRSIRDSDVLGQRKGGSRKTFGRTTEEEGARIATFLVTLCRRAYLLSVCSCIVSLKQTLWAAFGW
jgi:hypothetical protein